MIRVTLKTYTQRAIVLHHSVKKWANSIRCFCCVCSGKISHLKIWYWALFWRKRIFYSWIFVFSIILQSHVAFLELMTFIQGANLSNVRHVCIWIERFYLKSLELTQPKSYHESWNYFIPIETVGNFTSISNSFRVFQEWPTFVDYEAILEIFLLNILQ